MKPFKVSPLLPGIAVLLLSGAFVTASPAFAQSAQDNSAPQATAPAAQPSPNDASTYATGAPLQGQSKEGFWGHMNPFARKKWVARQVDPIRDRENELDQLQAKNANDIKDVDARAQAGISNAMTAANNADQHAAAAAQSAQAAQNLASNASDRTDTLGTKVNNLDQYQPVNSVDVPFARGRTALGPQGKADLDQVAQQLDGQKGYVVEVEGFSRGGVEPSQAMADSVVRYLVEQHQVPIYRIYRTGMGRQTVSSDQMASADNTSATTIPLTNGVRITLMQNSLGTFSNSQPAPQSSNAAPDTSNAPAPSTPQDAPMQ